MKKPIQIEKTPSSHGSLAPQSASDGARTDDGQPPQRKFAHVLSRNHRFMTGVLDKLKVNDPVKPAGGNDLPLSAGSHEESRADRFGDDAQPLRLDITGPSDNSSRQMTFTYAPGSQPLPRYTIRRGIGVGGFGEVYFAVNDAGKEVALKRIQRNLDVELRGAKQCMNLKHPNLVALFDICHDADEQAWVVMEYIAGPNLRQVLDSSPEGLPEDEARRWFAGIASGVNHLHSAGLVHRDLKPGNVFDDLGIIKVGDYGLSKFISASHRGGHTESVGTFHYMAPEIGRGQYGREIDIYALGILLYELLTGKVPFDGESCHEIIVKHLTAKPDLNGIIDPYRSVIAKALEKDPAERQSSVAELMQELSLPVREGVDSIPVAVAVAAPAQQASETTNPPIMAKLASASATEPSRSGDAAGSRLKGSFHGAAAASQDLRDEPLARAIRHSLADLNRWWATLDRSPGAKAFLVLVTAFVLIVNTHWLLPLLSVVAIFYVPYYIVRQMVLQARQQPTYAEAQRIATAVGAPRQPISRVQWRSHMRTDLRAKRSIHRLAELNTSWIAASFTILAMALGAGVIGLHSGPVDAVAIAPYGWMVAVVLIASFGLLGMGKLWEREDGEGLPRRLVLAGIGAGVGAVAFTMGEFLLLPTDVGLARGVDATSLPQALYFADGTPRISAMMAHFALLFAALRWWKPVDPLRRTRLSLWSVAVAVVAEWAIHQLLPIPQPSGMLIAGGIAIAIQMSAPWIDPRAARPDLAHSERLEARRVA